MRICKDGRIWGQNNKGAINHLGVMSTKTSAYHTPYAHKWREILRLEVLGHYGKGKVACVICGESRTACLSIDHINGRGAEHRRQIKVKGTTFYSWLRKREYPEGYQTLCMNCQWVKRKMNIEENSRYKEESK